MGRDADPVVIRIVTPLARPQQAIYREKREILTAQHNQRHYLAYLSLVLAIATTDCMKLIPSSSLHPGTSFSSDCTCLKAACVGGDRFRSVFASAKDGDACNKWSWTQRILARTTNLGGWEKTHRER